jgi:hypothetical protein
LCLFHIFSMRVFYVLLLSFCLMYPSYALFQAFFRGVKEIVFFWDFTQRRFVVCYRRFGTTYRPHLQIPISPSFGLLGSALFSIYCYLCHFNYSFSCCLFLVSFCLWSFITFVCFRVGIHF